MRYHRKLIALQSLAATAAVAFATTTASSAAQATYQEYRFTATGLRAPGTTTVQISEFSFSLAGAQVPYTGVVLENSGGTYAVDGAEGALKLIDADVNTKWLDANSNPVVFKFPTPVTIDSYNFSTANDFDGRDPVSWRLEGRASDLDNWVVLDQRTDFPTTTARFTAQTGFTLPTAILPFITYFDAYTPALEIPFGASTAIVPNGSIVDLAWAVTDADVVTVSPDPADAGAAGGRQVLPAPNADTRYVLEATSAAGSLSRSVTIRSVAGGSAQYRYVKFTPVRTRGGQAMIQLAEFEFYNSAGTEIVPVGATNPGGSNVVDGPEGAIRAIDGLTTTKWLDGNGQPLIVDFGASPEAFTTYRMVTGNDASERDAARWLLEGSADGVTWELVDNVTAFDYFMPLARTTLSAPIPVPGISLTPLVTFSGDSSVVVAGQPLVLTYNVRGAASATINGAPVAVGAGSLEVFPTESGSYELVATSGAGTMVSSTFSFEIAELERTTIDYADFSDAGDELALLRNAAIVNGRLRLTPNVNDRVGDAWFRIRQPLEEGFTTTFGLHLNKPVEGYYFGADGASFIIQNAPTGSGTLANGENGLAANALTVKFDPWQNEGEAGYARLEVRAGNTILTTVDLGTFPGVVLDTPVEGFDIPTITSRETFTPFPVRITYVPGALNVFFAGVQIVENLDVDLGKIGAINEDGTAFVGFSARTGGLAHASDITEWTLTPGAPVSTATLNLVNFSFNAPANQMTLTWSSSAGTNYRVTTSENLGAPWIPVAGATGIAGQAGTTSVTLPFLSGPRAFFRVEEE